MACPFPEDGPAPGAAPPPPGPASAPPGIAHSAFRPTAGGHVRHPPSEAGWGLVAACAALMAITSGVWYTASVFFVAFVRHFGWDYATTAGIFSLFTILYGLFGVSTGYLVDRVGPRRVIVGGGVLLALALVGDSLAAARWHLYVTHSVLAALGLAGMGWIPVSIILARGFQRRRGLAVGIASAGVGLGITTFVPITQAIIDRAGWRAAYGALAVVAASVILPVGLFAVPEQRAGRAARGPSPARTVSGALGAGGGPGMTLRGALGTRAFWLVAATFTFLNSPVQMVLTHQVAHLVEVGQPRAFVAAIVGLVGLVSVPGKILWGSLSDRCRIETIYLGGIALVVGGTATLLGVGPQTGAAVLYLYAALMGIGYAVSPAMTPVTGARFFAGRNFGAIFGALNLVHHLGGAAGVWLAGYAHDVTGNYRTSLYASMASAGIAAACIWLAAPRRLPA